MIGCEGTWQRVAYVGEDSSGAVNRCDGCGDWLVIIGIRGYNVPASAAATVEQAVRAALQERHLSAVR